MNELVPIGNFFQTQIAIELDCKGGTEINGPAPVLKAGELWSSRWLTVVDFCSRLWKTYPILSSLFSSFLLFVVVVEIQTNTMSLQNRVQMQSSLPRTFVVCYHYHLYKVHWHHLSDY